MFLEKSPGVNCSFAPVLEEFVAEVRRSIDYYRSRGGEIDREGEFELARTEVAYAARRDQASRVSNATSIGAFVSALWLT